MFVTRAKLDAAQWRADVAEAVLAKYKTSYHELLGKWNKLVGRVNDLGGEAFLNGGERAPQFTREEITKLIQLCHPDKHGGKQIATELTQKLLKMKETA